MKILKFGTLALIIFLMANCGGAKKDSTLDENISDKQLYDQSTKEVKAENYKKAVKTLTKLENEYPASEHYSDALVLKAYSYYSDDNYTDAILTVDDFLHQFPIDKNASYMYYIKGMSNYNQMMDVGRDQQFAIDAKKDFEMLINLFPNTKYANDAKWKVEYIDNTLAGKEMDIGRFYLRVYKPISSVSRFKNVIEKYQTSIFTPEALYRLVEVYYILGVKDEATRYASVLGYNYPSSIWYRKSYDILLKNPNDRNTSKFKNFFKHM
jgi:outer membrane protein assembly factor BamD